MLTITLYVSMQIAEISKVPKCMECSQGTLTYEYLTIKALLFIIKLQSGLDRNACLAPSTVIRLKNLNKIYPVSSNINSQLYQPAFEINFSII